MGYEVRYATDEAGRKQAIADIKDWLGEDKFSELDGLLRQLPEPMSFRKMSMMFMLSGISGFPLQAWRDDIWGPEEIQDEE